MMSTLEIHNIVHIFLIFIMKWLSFTNFEKSWLGNFDCAVFYILAVTSDKRYSVYILGLENIYQI